MCEHILVMKNNNEMHFAYDRYVSGMLVLLRTQCKKHS